MTREEAITNIEYLEWALDLTDEHHKALDMAIEALSEPINCIKCKHYYETEDDTGVHGHCRMDTVTLNSPISIQADLVSVPLCKDCKHYIVEGITTQYGWCHEYKHSVNEDDFCSYGERG